MFRFPILTLPVAVCAFFFPGRSIAQNSPVRQAEKRMSQGNWPAARQLLLKAIQKDSSNTEAELLLTRWFLDPLNPSHEVDSAYRHSALALHAFQRSSPKQRDRLKRNNVDSTFFLHLRKKIDSLAFEKAKAENTESAYADFLSRHPHAVQQHEAIELRDEVAFLNALRQNTAASFDAYLQRYPQSHRAREARSRLEKLLYEWNTKDKKLSSYQAFLRKFPSSPYRIYAEKNIFELTTCTGSLEDFFHFIEEYPSSHYTRRARDLLFHLMQESDEKKSMVDLSDSLRHIVEINKRLWIPVYKNERYGFIDSRGVEMFAPQFERIAAEYKCGAIKDDVLLVNRGIISRSGRVLAQSVGSMRDLGFGFLSVGDSDGIRVMHKSGWWVTAERMKEAKVLEGRFLLMKKNDVWALYALNGRMILDFQWASIDYLDGALVLDRGKKILCTLSQIKEVADGHPLPENFVFDKVASLGQGRLLVTNGSLEGMVNTRLEFVVPLARQSLLQMPFGLTRKINDKYIFGGLTKELENTSWEKFQFYRQWLSLKNQGEQKLVDTFSKKTIEENADSLWFANGLAFARVSDSIHVYINSSVQLSLPRAAHLSFVKSPDSVRYFFTESKTKKTIYSIETGKKLFTSEADQVESFTAEVFLVTRKNKKGLVSLSGKIILPSEYDALLLREQNRVSLLKEKKFGLFDMATSRLIKPLFERNLTLLDSTMLVAFKGGHYGVMDWSMKPITLFEFDEIQPWKKKIIWTKKGFEWTLLDLRSSSPVLTHVKKIIPLKDRPSEKVVMIQQENYFGVFSSEAGLFIPASFSTIVNLGSEDEPLYFTSKEVEEAGIIVVIYYDRSGKFIRKQVYEEEEYGHLACPED